MALFADDALPSVDELLREPVVTRLLELLVKDVVCLTVGQAHLLLREAGPPEIHAHRFHKHVRSVLHQLEKAELVGSETVERLPPAFAGEPVFRIEKTEVDFSSHRRENPWAAITFAKGRSFSVEMDYFESHFKELTASELARFSELAKTRVPPLEAHRPARIYFATKNASKLFPEPGLWMRVSSRLDTEKRAKELIHWHRAIADGSGASCQEIAGTQLTAMLAVNQFALSERFHQRIAAQEWIYSSAARERTNCCDGRLRVRSGEYTRLALFFLRPLLPDEIAESIKIWWDEKRTSTSCWWI